ncbi:MAG: ABC transporter substrate-binding protein [Gammaproteobacteria bacterium]|nr:ABC transporter substrate-binding protein [Gammaproteobacteria bacterium]
MQRARVVIVIVLACLVGHVSASPPTLKVGVLKFGTVNWELQTIKRYQLDTAEGFNLEVVHYAGKMATTTALHGRAVDAIVNDWIWVSRQRSEGRSYSFIPYSLMGGSLMVPADSNITTVDDLRGKKIGIAGGPLDKNWLLIQAIAKKHHNINLSDSLEEIYGAPPLLSKKLEMAELDGVITFWHYAAKLEAKGFRRIIDAENTLIELGVKKNIPMIGYVFTPELLQDRRMLVQALYRASRKAKKILTQQPAAWEALKPLMKTKSERSFLALKEGFLKGIPLHWGTTERREAAHLYRLLATIGGKKLVGNTNKLDQGSFIDDIRY